MRDTKGKPFYVPEKEKLLKYAMDDMLNQPLKSFRSIKIIPNFFLFSFTRDFLKRLLDCPTIECIR